jgi:hypothetical protein
MEKSYKEKIGKLNKELDKLSDYKTKQLQFDDEKK